MMAASKLNEASRLDRRWTSESASTRSPATSTSTGKGTARARSASGSIEITSTTAGRSPRSAQTATSVRSDSKRSKPRAGSTKTVYNSSSAARTADPTTRSLGHSSRPTRGPSSGHDSTAGSSNFGLTSGAKTAIIVATVIGGLLILALLVILLFRGRKKGPKPADIPYLRPPSTTTFLSTKTRDANLTALPMYRERRKQLAEAGNRQPRILPDMQELYRHDPRHQDLWKTANPPTPITDRFSAEHGNESSDAPPVPPEMAHMRGTSPIFRISSRDDANLNPAESIYAPSAIDLEAGMWPYTPLSEDTMRDRWSWSTSYATAKSKAGAQSLTSTIASLPGVRRVREWIASSPDEQREPVLTREGDPGPSRANSVTFLKNKATKPNLAPVPTGELSGRQIDPEIGASANALNATRAQRKGSDGMLEAIDAVLPEDGVIS